MLNEKDYRDPVFVQTMQNTSISLSVIEALNCNRDHIALEYGKLAELTHSNGNAALGSSLDSRPSGNIEE